MSATRQVDLVVLDAFGRIARAVTAQIGRDDANASLGERAHELVPCTARLGETVKQDQQWSVGWAYFATMELCFARGYPTALGGAARSGDGHGPSCIGSVPGGGGSLSGKADDSGSAVPRRGSNHPFPDGRVARHGHRFVRLAQRLQDGDGIVLMVGPAAVDIGTRRCLGAVRVGA